MKFINMTPHEIVVMPEEGGEIRIPATGKLVRCKAERGVVDTLEVNGVKIPVTQVVLGEIENLPEPEEGVFYIISLQAALKARDLGRTADLLVPDMAVRDESGRIIGVRALARQ